MSERSKAAEAQAVRDGSAAYSVQAGPITVEDVPPGYKRTEFGVIPADWNLRPLKEIFNFSNGINAEKGAYGQGIPFINVLEPITYSHIRAPDIPGKVRVSTRVVGLYSIKFGDIVFNRTSETQDELGLAAVFVGESIVVFGGFVIRAHPITATLDPIYSGYGLRAPLVRSQIVAKGQGAVRANIGQESLRGIHVPVPAIQEQHAIATALSDADALIESLDRLIAKKRAIKQAVMQQLLTGKTRLPGFTGEWEMKRLGEVAEIDSENLDSNTFPDYTFSYISLEQVEEGALLGCSIEKFRTAPSRARRVLRHDDVLVSTVRPNLKSHLRFRCQFPNAVCSTGFSVVRCDQLIANPGYIYAHFFGNFISRQIDKIIAGSNYPAISSSDVRRLELPIPLLGEQTAIATTLFNMDTEIEVLERRRDKARQIKQGMMQELLTGRTRLVEPEHAA